MKCLGQHERERMTTKAAHRGHMSARYISESRRPRKCYFAVHTCRNRKDHAATPYTFLCSLCSRQACAMCQLGTQAHWAELLMVS